MDRAHRHDLKHDKFVEQVGHSVEYATEHKQDFVKWGGIAAVVLVAALGWLMYSRSQAETRQEELRRAIRTQEAAVGSGASEFLVSFPTAAEKQTAVQKAWNDLASKRSGTAEGAVAHYYLGVNAADRGDLQEAEKQFKVVADSGEDEFAAQAKLSLATMYSSMGKTSEAESILRALIANPTVLVSKEQATIALARLMMKDRPAEARKLLEPLRTNPGAVSRVAITLLGEIPNK